MPTQKGGYYLKSGERVPSVTMVIGRFKEAGGLIHWAWKLGKEGKDYREVRDQAADAGTMAHAAMEAWIRDKPFEFEGPAEITDKAKVSFGAFLKWAEQTRLTVTHSEMPLVSETYKFGGTFDAILAHNTRAIGDWKCSGSLYTEYLIQVAAYGKLWEENFPGEPIEGGFHLLRFDKIHGDFTHRWWGELSDAWRAFRHLLALYQIEKELKERIK
jgi:hypothetical protein